MNLKLYKNKKSIWTRYLILNRLETLDPKSIRYPEWTPLVYSLDTSVPRLPCSKFLAFLAFVLKLVCVPYTSCLPLDVMIVLFDHGFICWVWKFVWSKFQFLSFFFIFFFCFDWLLEIYVCQWWKEQSLQQPHEYVPNEFINFALTLWL